MYLFKLTKPKLDYQIYNGRLEDQIKRVKCVAFLLVRDRCDRIAAIPTDFFSFGTLNNETNHI